MRRSCLYLRVCVCPRVHVAFYCAEGVKYMPSRVGYCCLCWGVESGPWRVTGGVKGDRLLCLCFKKILTPSQ